MGAGLINVRVFSRTKYAKIKCMGLAFGLGIERFTMIFYKVINIKNFFENTLHLSNIF
jgi:phenylalanyl-tRNA synthetase alpha chain